MTHTDTKLTFMQNLSKYWFILAFLFATIVAWTTLNNKVDGHTEDIKVLKAADAQVAATNIEILVKLSEIKTELLWIKNSIR